MSYFSQVLSRRYRVPHRWQGLGSRELAGHDTTAEHVHSNCSRRPSVPLLCYSPLDLLHRHTQEPLRLYEGHLTGVDYCTSNVVQVGYIT